MKILNIYCGIGGNRKLWGNEHEITAVEYDENIAKIYQDNFPNDKVVIGDAHQYLLDNFKDFETQTETAHKPCFGNFNSNYIEQSRFKVDSLLPFGFIFFIKSILSLVIEFSISNLFVLGDFAKPLTKKDFPT